MPDQRELDKHLIDITPAPIFSRLERLYDRVFGRVKMFGRVCILRGIATADVAADQTFAQMYPGISHLQTLLATVSAGRNILYLISMCALLRH